MVVDLQYTGERLVPDQFMLNQRIVTEHVERYRYAARTIHDHIKVNRPKIMDVPCGSGYGAALLAEQTGAYVYGYDNDISAVMYARQRYGQHLEGAVAFEQMDMEDVLPIGIFDVVTCFEGIEHVNNQIGTAASLCLALKQDGLIFVSTPRRGGPGGGSEFHTVELLRDELVALFEPHLSQVKVLGQDLRVGDSKPDEHARFYVLVGRR